MTQHCDYVSTSNISCLMKNFKLPTGALLKKSGVRTTTDSPHPSFPKDIDKSELKMDMACVRKIKNIDDERFDNTLNETLVKLRDNSSFDVKTGQIPGDEGSYGKEEVDNKDKTSKDDGRDTPNGNPDDPDKNDGDPDSPPDETDEERKQKIKKIAVIAGIATLAAIATPFAVAGALSAAGFGSAGVVGGSVAAAWQASVGNVAAGSTFAVLQSAGAAGLGSTGIAASAAAGGGIFAVVGAGVSKFFGKGNNKNNKSTNVGESSDVTSMVVDACGKNPKNSSGK